MLIKQLVGRYSGEIVDFPFAIAQEKLKNKTAVLPDEVEQKPKRRGRPRKNAK